MYISRVQLFRTFHWTIFKCCITSPIEQNLSIFHQGGKEEVKWSAFASLSAQCLKRSDMVFRYVLHSKNMNTIIHFNYYRMTKSVPTFIGNLTWLHLHHQLCRVTKWSLWLFIDLFRYFWHLMLKANMNMFADWKKNEKTEERRKV